MRRYLARNSIDTQNAIWVNTGTNNITTSAYLELVASLAGSVSAVQIMNSTTRYIGLAVGAAGSEVVYVTVGPSSNLLLPLPFEKGVRLSAISKNVNATASFFVVNFLC